MSEVLIYFFLAIGLSMDAFSLALAYGMNKLPLSKIITTGLFVGIFHFIMPNLGAIVGKMFLNRISFNTNLLVAIIFLFLAIDMFINRHEEQNDLITNLFSILLFAFSVSIDSFSVGIALGITKASLVVASLIFAIISAFFTFLGLFLGKKLSEKLGEKALYLGIIILIGLALKYLF